MFLLNGFYFIEFRWTFFVFENHLTCCILVFPLSGQTRKKKMNVIPLTIGAWNVRTLMDSSGSDRPQRRTALVGRELDRYKVEIAALSETRLAEESF